MVARMLSPCDPAFLVVLCLLVFFSTLGWWLLGLLAGLLVRCGLDLVRGGPGYIWPKDPVKINLDTSLLCQDASGSGQGLHIGIGR